MQTAINADTKESVAVFNELALSPFVFVCEHGSNYIPSEYNDLGVDATARNSHIAWDIGALEVAGRLATLLDGTLVHSTRSRLLYDCNRPPDAKDASPEKSEFTRIPGNQGLSPEQRADRARQFYEPFRNKLSRVLDNAVVNTVLVTMHSFTPVYNGVERSIDIGVIHDSDERLADALLDALHHLDGFDIRRNEPYGPADGVTHTLKEHGLRRGMPNVMIEVKNSLVDTSEKQEQMAQVLGKALQTAITNVDHK